MSKAFVEIHRAKKDGNRLGARKRRNLLNAGQGLLTAGQLRRSRDVAAQMGVELEEDYWAMFDLCRADSEYIVVDLVRIGRGFALSRVPSPLSRDWSRLIIQDGFESEGMVISFLAQLAGPDVAEATHRIRFV